MKIDGASINFLKFGALNFHVVVMHASLISKWQMLDVLVQTVLSLTSIDWVDCMCVSIHSITTMEYIIVPVPASSVRCKSPGANTGNQLTYVSNCDTTCTPPSGEIRYLEYNTTLLQAHYSI